MRVITAAAHCHFSFLSGIAAERWNGAEKRATTRALDSADQYAASNRVVQFRALKT
jgi:hypothetical protein